MNSFFRCLMNLVGVLGLWMICFPGVSVSYQPISAELTANINLRESSDKNGKIIMQLKKGDRVYIQTETPKWAKIVYDKNGKQIYGWISAQYLQKTASLSPELKAKVVDEKPAGPVPPPVSDIIFMNPSQHSVSDTQAPEPQIIVSESPESPDTTLPRAQSPLSGDDVSAFFNSKESSPAIIEASAAKSGSSQSPPSTFEFIAVITRFLFKISIVVTSCFALIFSYSALQIAKSNLSGQRVHQ